jgi:hypothetical protein
VISSTFFGPHLLAIKIGLVGLPSEVLLAGLNKVIYLETRSFVPDKRKQPASVFSVSNLKFQFELHSFVALFKGLDNLLRNEVCIRKRKED